MLCLSRWGPQTLNPDYSMLGEGFQSRVRLGHDDIGRGGRAPQRELVLAAGSQNGAGL